MVEVAIVEVVGASEEAEAVVVIVVEEAIAAAAAEDIVSLDYVHIFCQRADLL